MATVPGTYRTIAAALVVSMSASAYGHLGPQSTVGDILRHPAFAGFSRLILPWDDRAYDERLPLSEIGSLLPYHTHVDPETVASALNVMIDDAAIGRKVFYSFYSEAQVQQEPARKHTGLFFFRGRLDTIQERLRQASSARAQEKTGGNVLYAGDANLTDELIAKLPFDLYRQGYHYYWKTHAHSGSTFKYTMSSLLDLMRWDATDQIELVNQPLLMIAGSKADSLYMTEDAFAKATGTKNKELFRIDRATHIETYWVPKYVDAAMDKLTAFYSRTL